MVGLISILRENVINIYNQNGLIIFKTDLNIPIRIHPGTWQVYYDYMFSGFSIMKEKRQIIGCLQDILQRTPVADPVDRPSASIKEFGYISKRKAPVDAEEIVKPTRPIPLKAEKSTTAKSGKKR